VLKHGSARRRNLSQLTKSTLGSGNLLEAVRPPKNVDLSEWMATNIVDFYNEISVLYDLCSEDSERFQKSGEGFPPLFEYRWADPNAGKKNSRPIRVSSPIYVNNVLNWIQDTVNDEYMFPVGDDDDFPEEFQTIAEKVFTRIFRIYAIIYHSHFEYVESHGAAQHLNTSLKHFVIFVHYHGLVQPKEFEALKEPVQHIIMSSKLEN